MPAAKPSIHASYSPRGGGPTGRELSAVTERDVVRHKHGDGPLRPSSVDGQPHILPHRPRCPAREPDGLGSVGQGSDEVGRLLVSLRGPSPGDLPLRPVIRRRDIQILGRRRGCRRCGRPQQRRHNRGRHKGGQPTPHFPVCRALIPPPGTRSRRSASRDARPARPAVAPADRELRAAGADVRSSRRGVPEAHRVWDALHHDRSEFVKAHVWQMVADVCPRRARTTAPRRAPPRRQCGRRG